jgi:hypothetical protein
LLTDPLLGVSGDEINMHHILSDRKTATTLAALRFWQRVGLTSAGREQNVATDGGRFLPLSAQEIDALCERINCGDDGSVSGMRGEREGAGQQRSDESDADEARKPTCPQCGSDNVVADAAARWNPDAPARWEVSCIFDKGHGCDDCGAEDIEFVWTDVPMPPTLTSLSPDDGLGSGTGSAPDDPTSYSYRVTWIIDVEADSPHDAALSARATQLNPNSIATIFTIKGRDGTVLCIDTDDLAAAGSQPFLVTR